MAVNKFVTTTGYTVLVSLLSLLSFFAGAQTPALKLEDGKVWVSGIEPEVLYTFSRYFNSQKDWEAVFPITIKDHSNAIVVNGEYLVLHNAICFTPRFPFAPRVQYKAQFFAADLAKNTNEVYLPAMDDKSLELNFSIVPKNESVASVFAVYPSSDVVPENLLKFHIQFSKSMSMGEAYTRIKLMDASGNEIEKPFLILDQELWDDEMKTLTLLFDPGRIKRGLRPNVEMKPALRSGTSYSLVIKKGWKDIDGNTTQTDFIKTFTCVAADRTIPMVAKYAVVSPPFERAPLIINLHEEMNYILLSQAIQVFDASGNNVEGTTYARNNETVIEFVPENPWSCSRYTIHFNQLAEDLAGNNLNRLFDEDLTSEKRSNQPLNSLSFEVIRTAR